MSVQVALDYEMAELQKSDIILNFEIVNLYKYTKMCIAMVKVIEAADIPKNCFNI